MSPNFVRYTPDIETIDPNIDELIEQIVKFWEKRVRESPTTEGTGRATRGAHAKSLGVVRAEVEFLADVPAPYAQGVYAKPGRHGALLRFSSANNHLGPDAHLGPVLGLAIKIFDVDGTKLVDDEPDGRTFDLVLKNSPFFVANTARHYLVLQEVGNDAGQYLARGKAGFRDFLTDFLTGKGRFEQSDWAWEELFAYVKTATQTPVSNPLLTPYWSMGSVRHGDYVAKVRVAPTDDSVANAIHPKLDLTSAPDVFGPALADELQARGFDFELQIQLCADVERMPVNDTTVEWPESVSPFVTVGRVHVPPQVVAQPDDEKADALAFNQWRVTAEHRPLGEIMQVRKIYSTSARVRRVLNHQPESEPTSPCEVLPDPETASTG
jgi:hypothetical protein